MSTNPAGPDTSDGYHTFAELYRYRMLYNALLFNEWAAAGKFDVHKAHQYSDGSTYDGWFIVTAQLPTGQISNHYPDHDWGLFKIPEHDRAAIWDGHTPLQAAARMTAWLRSMHAPDFAQPEPEATAVPLPGNSIEILVTDEHIAEYLAAAPFRESFQEGLRAEAAAMVAALPARIAADRAAAAANVSEQP